MHGRPLVKMGDRRIDARLTGGFCDAVRLVLVQNQFDNKLKVAGVAVIHAVGDAAQDVPDLVPLGLVCEAGGQGQRELNLCSRARLVTLSNGYDDRMGSGCSGERYGGSTTLRIFATRFLRSSHNAT